MKYKCLFCDCDIKKTSVNFGKYCSNRCQSDYLYNKLITEWKSGNHKGYTGKTIGLSKWIRRYLLEKYSNTCSKCGWNELHPVDKLPLVEINHIDGNAKNCKEENLEVLCPNCHSKTENYGNRNKTSSRPKMRPAD